MLITFPAAPVPATIEWAIDQPAQVNRGEFTGRRRATILAAAPRWFATVTLPPILGEDRVLDWRAFVVDLDGVANSFRLVAVERDQLPAGVAVSVDGAGQGGLQLATKGWGAPGLKLKRGQFVTVGDQLLMLRAPVIADAAGKAILSLKPYIRLTPADGAPIEVRRPYAVMAMSDTRNGWSVGIGQNYAISFQCEEAF
ncbi:hypothetical protein [Sphingomonas dokdonensis]|uniref:Uncharacterized protein n=1 Tax=Sphingomonas dokdonensis TaxID=344880 RepID=A0A245ZD13_9SPHN|nr:hypothetical protein [Sphingomonas dokdonensis]OWK27583.1 hypothetical protein SPDO_32660 [Sphingomonas dokdonensis]